MSRRGTKLAPHEIINKARTDMARQGVDSAEMKRLFDPILDEVDALHDQEPAIEEELEKLRARVQRRKGKHG